MPVLPWLPPPHVCDCRYDVYICTTASRQYAEAIWTLMDLDQSVFPFEELSWRLLAVPPGEKKDLLNVLRYKDMGGVPITNAGEFRLGSGCLLYRVFPYRTVGRRE